MVDALTHTTNSRYDLLARGIYVDPIIPVSRLQRLTQRLQPIATGIELLRIGAESDGGYLIPDDLTEISACFSPGVDQIASFEAGLLKYGIPSHLADFSVDGVPEGISVASFTKKFIRANNNIESISLENWIKSKPEYVENKDLILQMDIEGGEYESILSTPNEILKKFRIAAIEFHNIETWAQSDYFSIVEATFEKLLEIFYVVHNHPNNAMGIVNLNGFLTPRLLEITFLRKDRALSYDKFMKLPHPLDRANIQSMPDLHFPEGWFK